MSTKAIEIKDLKKTYKGGFEALKGISLSVEQGEFFGLLGPNGAGKSTTIGIICSLVNKTSGEVFIAGHDIVKDPANAKKKLGIVPQEYNFNIFESCEHGILNQAGYYGVPRSVALHRLTELLDQLGLADKRHVAAGKLSGGLKRRLMIARALIHEPDILILDEPTAGVDIALRRSMWQFIADLNKKKNMTIILTTHYLEEAEALCNRIAIINKGQIIEDSPTHVLLQKLHSETFILYGDTRSEIPPLEGYIIRKIDSETIETDLLKDQSIDTVIAHLNRHGIAIHRLRNKANRLEETFVHLVENKND
jgi:ABC-2 type transport system ATP-binding protein